jgi:cell division protein FtsB
MTQRRCHRDDLAHEGTGAVEERARYELGMVKEGEIFVQVLDGGTKSSAQDSAKQ